MANKEETLKVLQMIVTELSSNSMQHRFQAKIFGAQGFSKLEEKYMGHATEEIEFVEQFMDRIMDLGGTLVQQEMPAQKLYEDVEEYLKSDLKVSVDGIKTIVDLMESGIFDITTYDLMKEYLKDEEEDMYWTESQLELIEKIGIQNYLNNQL
ncbi:MAG: bacterioferritin [Methanosphaera stadtmanae]|jgi:bacterioferritin|nr:bacterioferritin [Methanosphaera stadtmanae]